MVVSVGPALADLTLSLKPAPSGASLVIKNTAAAQTQILKVVVGPGISNPNFASQPLAAGAEVVVALAYSNERPAGIVSSVVKVYSTGNPENKIALQLPRPEVQVSDRQVFFGKLYVGAQVEKRIEVKGEVVEVKSSDSSVTVNDTGSHVLLVTPSTKSVAKIRANIVIKSKEREYQIPVFAEVLPVVQVSPPAILLGELSKGMHREFKVSLVPGLKAGGAILAPRSHLGIDVRPAPNGVTGIISVRDISADIDEVVEMQIVGAPNYQLRVTGVAPIRTSSN